ncbi:MAG: SDR family NAD(P)-dependent oxidoreductase [Chloroflexi bacterium]|nr:SDR family NAD(P)-dependent oxidoreductase [Chloroflexota bacterium]
MARLQGKIALVTGASRGAGRGIARVLGEEGAPVYVTGRRTRENPHPEFAGCTIDDTVDQVNARGGRGIAVQVDHTNDGQVEALFEQIQREQGRLDILVNNIWGGYEDDMDTFTDGFWKQPLARLDKMFDAGIRAHFSASQYAARMMIPQKSGLIINTTFWDEDKYISNLPYDIAKAAINRMAFSMAYELHDYNIAAIALSPGWMRTEVILAHYSPGKQTTDTEFSFEGWEITESIEYIGRAVTALATDPNVMEKSGKTLTVGGVAQEYGFVDIDGRSVPPFTFTITREQRDLTP